MSDLLEILISTLGRLCMGICNFLGFIDGATKKLNENSRVGESPMDRALREKRRRWVGSAFACACTLAVMGFWLTRR
jgi:hypothetical protein